MLKKQLKILFFFSTLVTLLRPNRFRVDEADNFTVFVSVLDILTPKSSLWVCDTIYIREPAVLAAKRVELINFPGPSRQEQSFGCSEPETAPIASSTSVGDGGTRLNALGSERLRESSIKLSKPGKKETCWAIWIS